MAVTVVDCRKKISKQTIAQEHMVYAIHFMIINKVFNASILSQALTFHYGVS